MTMEDQVCTHQQAIRLKGLEITGPSILFWKCNDVQTVVVSQSQRSFYEKYFDFNNWLPAYTSSELGLMLPSYIHTNKSVDKYDLQKGKYFSRSDIVGGMPRIYANTEAHARAECLIWLLEHGEVTADVANSLLES